MQETYRASREREHDLNTRVDQLKGGLLDLRRRSIQYNIYQRDVDTNRELYAALLQRYKEIGVAGGVGVNNISVVDTAEMPRKPSSPKIVLNMVLALLAGLGLGIAAAFGLEQIDEGIADPADVEENLNVPLLGTVPRTADGDPLEALRDRKSALAEAYLSLQTNLSFTTDHGIPQDPGGDQRQPRRGQDHDQLCAGPVARPRQPPRPSSSTAILRSPLDPHHVRREERARPQQLSVGRGGSRQADRADRFFGPSTSCRRDRSRRAPPNCSRANRLEQLIGKAAEQFDHVIIDAPPVMGLADSPLIASRVEGVVFVLEAHQTKRSTARVALARLNSANAQIIGVVLSKFDAKRAHYGYGYDYGYGYGYGDAAKEEHRRPDGERASARRMVVRHRSAVAGRAGACRSRALAFDGDSPSPWCLDRARPEQALAGGRQAPPPKPRWPAICSNPRRRGRRVARAQESGARGAAPRTRQCRRQPHPGPDRRAGRRPGRREPVCSLIRKACRGATSRPRCG